MYKICHTEESSRRQRALEQGLLAAMKRQPYEKITLTDLCRQLALPRKTFYRYFPTKDDCLLALIDHTLSDCNDIALKGWSGGATLDSQAQLRFFRYWQEHRVFLDVMQTNGLEPLLLDRTTMIVDRMKEKSPPATFAREQVEYFIAHGLMHTVIRWHKFGFRSTPEEMAEVFERILGTDRVSLSRLLF